MTLNDLAGSHWQGTGELWTDPLGNDVQTSRCSLHVEANTLRYTWQFDGQPQHGSIVLDAEGGVFTDSWHSPAPMRCAPAGQTVGLVDLLGSYGAGDGPPWGWRLLLSLRPAFEGMPESLVLQMTNIAPWGEEARAVRMITQRQ